MIFLSFFFLNPPLTEGEWVGMVEHLLIQFWIQHPLKNSTYNCVVQYYSYILNLLRFKSQFWLTYPMG